MAGASIPVFSPCRDCKLYDHRSFCHLPLEARTELDRIREVRTFAPGEKLFDEGKPVNEVMIACQGAAILSFSSSTGNTVMLGVSEQSEVLGLSSAFSGRAHEGSAEAIENTTVSVIPRAEFMNFLEHFPAAALNAGPELSRKVSRAYDKIRLTGSGLSVRQRVAAWLLRLQGNGGRVPGPVTIALTHERIAQLLGVSRESVTRALSDFRKHGIIDVKGIRLRVCDRSRLESVVFARNQRNSKSYRL
jgi:CRP/FNR family transcriptional regulator, cyclic AMP receptor protein